MAAALIVIGMCSAACLLMWAVRRLPEFDTNEAEHHARLQGEPQ
jgi:hypothetical protein